MQSWKELIADAVQAKRGAVDRLRKVKAAKTVILADLRLADKVGEGCEVRYWIDSWDQSLHATVELTVVEFKTDALLAAVLERALMVGTESRTHDNVSEWQAERVFRFALPNGGTLKVAANLKADGERCRKVQVGATTTVSPTYELRCD